jgi:DNA-binding LytR/AlgR family response regulator
LIAEDEPLMRERLKEKLADAWPELDIVAEAADGSAALEAFAAASSAARLPRHPHARQERARRGRGDRQRLHIVFITAYDQYALKAFEAGASTTCSSPSSPIASPQPSSACARSSQRRRGPDGAGAELRSTLVAGRAAMKWIKAAVGKQVKLISVADVLYFQSDAKYTRVVLGSGEALIRTPLKELMAELDPDHFCQIHRGTIVNLDAVAGVWREDAERQFVLLKNRQEKLPISRQFTHLFKQM